MKKRVCAPAVIAALLFAGCGGKGERKHFASLADFEGVKMASQTGAVFAQFVDPAIPNVKHVNYNTLPEIEQALISGKVDAASLDKPVAKYMAVRRPELMVFPEAVAPDRYGFAVAKGSELGVKGNEALQKFKRDGTLAELEDFWFYTDESSKKLPTLHHKSDFSGGAGTLVYGCETSLVPMSYMSPAGKPTGFELDVVTRIGYELDMKVEIVPMTFAHLLPSLASGKINIAGGSMSITEERLKTVDFIGSHYEGGIVLVIRKDRFGK